MCHQERPPQKQVRGAHHRPTIADGEVGGELPRSLCHPERCVGHGTQRHPWPTCPGRAGHRANWGGAEQQGYRLSVYSSDCNSYRGISLLSIVGKVFARGLLARLQGLVARVYPESQCGFRAGRSTIDMVFSVRQLQEKCREQNKPLYLGFTDLTKAFDLVSRSGLFKILKKVGCPQDSLPLSNPSTRTCEAWCATMEPFPISSGVKQGCVLAPTLFGTFFSMLLSYAFHGNDNGVYLHIRSDGRLFNLTRLRVKDQDTGCHHQRSPVCWQCSPGDPYQTSATEVLWTT